MKYIKFVRIFLLVLIIVGVGLLITQKIWVPKLVDKILVYQGYQSISKPASNSFEWCVANGGENITPNYNALKVCVLDNKVYEENCVSNNKYFVISKNKTDSVGTNILIKYKSSPNQNLSCDYLYSDGDFKIEGDAEYIMALENNFLILDSGTGPDPRGLIVYDLNLRKKIYEGSYSKPVDVQNNTVNYWAETTKIATEQNCPELKTWQNGGLEAAIDARVSLNLITLIKKESGEYRCSSRQ
jgi:hypothetical protein